MFLKRSARGGMRIVPPYQSFPRLLAGRSQIAFDLFFHSTFVNKRSEQLRRASAPRRVL
jgi:hypothetical protein